MKIELFPFQKQALSALRMNTAEALGSFRRTHTPQVVSFMAPTGAGKTIIMAALIENILCGDDCYPDQPEAIFVWLSDSPQLNEQSKWKIDLKADNVSINQTDTIKDESLDQEVLEDGQIYFLNTQKLSKGSNLTKKGDGRTYTIWETLANTAKKKSDRLYIIIDEAHRGIQGKKADEATTIMQKFIKGSEELPPMPVVIGMSATPERFNRLVKGTTSTIHQVIVDAKDVRASGLLKDRIIITYPEEKTINKDMAVLQAAADDWKEKWDHWKQYCTEQHYAQVNPVFVVQVENGTKTKLSETNLDDCLKKIEERVGYKFDEWQVVHCFGQTEETVTINGLPVHYMEASDISDNRNVRVVFFKESLSTGWDCPRAETMMSFRHASDATYIAQLLGRMVRTPMQMHIQVDDVLNDVHLYLPHFDEATVKDVINALQAEEGGNIPTEIHGEGLKKKTFVNLTARRKNVRKEAPTPPNSPSLFGNESEPHDSTQDTPSTDAPFQEPNHEERPTPTSSSDNAARPSSSTEKSSSEKSEHKEETAVPGSDSVEPVRAEDPFDREEVMRFINDSGLLSYNVRKVQISNYLSSYLEFAHLLNMSGLDLNALEAARDEIAKMIRDYVEGLKQRGEYTEKVNQVKQFRLSTQIFDVFGETVDNYAVHDLFTTTDTDIERQFRLAESKLKRLGLGTHYGKKYYDRNDPNAFMVDVILFAADDDCMNQLQSFAKKRFDSLYNQYRRDFAKIQDESIRHDCDTIVSNSDIISKHNFRLPESIQVQQEDGKEYRDHLFVDDETGTAKIKLNAWEEGVLAEEEQREDFVCWIRNIPRASWALCVPYRLNNEYESSYPDLIIVRKDEKYKYVIDILEPHWAKDKDNLGKAQGFAEYANQHPGLGRIQLIRQSKDIAGKSRFRRLDMSDIAVRDKLKKMTTSADIDNLFETDGFFM